MMRCVLKDILEIRSGGCLDSRGPDFVGGFRAEELASLRSMFFRYLYVLRDKEDEVIRKNAFNSLLFNQKNAVFSGRSC